MKFGLRDWRLARSLLIAQFASQFRCLGAKAPKSNRLGAHCMIKFGALPTPPYLSQTLSLSLCLGSLSSFSLYLSTTRKLAICGELCHHKWVKIGHKMHICGRFAMDIGLPHNHGLLIIAIANINDDNCYN